MDGQELRRRREALGLSQEQLAAKLGMTASTVYRWERGVSRAQRSTLIEAALERLERERAGVR